MDKQTRLARTILNGFTAYFAEFENITLAARTRFELAEWGIMQEISTRRIDLYKEKVLETLEYVNVIADDRISDFTFWTETRAVYVELVRGMTNFEIAETFYNSIYNSVFGHHRIRNEHAFVFSPQGDMPPVDVRRVVKRFGGDLRDSVATLLSQYAVHIPYENLERDCESIVAAIEGQLSEVEGKANSTVELHTLEHHFYRNKAVYIVGRIAADGVQIPFVLPMLQSRCRGASCLY